MKPPRFTRWLTLALVVVAPRVGAETHIFEQGLDGFTGFRDTSLFQDLPNNAGGGIDGTFSGTIRTGFLRRAILAVDLSALPPDTVVVSARLEMVVERSGGNFGDIPYTLHRLTRDWGEGTVAIPGEPGGLGAPAEEGDATWTHARFGSEPWSTPGGDFAAEPSATANAGQQGSLVIWEGPALTADVQAWIAEPSGNFGWIVITPQEGTIQRVKKFFSAEAEVNRPRLIIETEDPVEPPPPTGPGPWFWLLLFGLLRWLRRFFWVG